MKNSNKQENQVRSALLPNELGLFRMHVWPGERGRELVVLSTEKINPKEWVIVRLHSECLTGDLFGCRRCDCGEQLREAMSIIQKEGNGLIIYQRQEGRNYGLYEKMKVYSHDDTHRSGFVSAWQEIGMTEDRRTFEEIPLVAEYFNLQKIKLLTSNKGKMQAFVDAGLEVESIAHNVSDDSMNQAYVAEKQNLSDYL